MATWLNELKHSIGVGIHVSNLRVSFVTTTAALNLKKIAVFPDVTRSIFSHFRRHPLNLAVISLAAVFEPWWQTKATRVKSGRP